MDVWFGVGHCGRMYGLGIEHRMVFGVNVLLVCLIWDNTLESTCTRRSGLLNKGILILVACRSMNPKPEVEELNFQAAE
jgi:hypothetical protein